MTDGFYAPWVVLAQEPWCFDPDQLARLTRRQAEEMYLWPAVDRLKPTAKPSSSGPLAVAWDWNRDGLPPKPRFVAVMLDTYGGEAARWEADWERLKAAEDASRGQK